MKPNDHKRIINPGPYLGLVKHFGDPTGQGRIAVFIPRLAVDRQSSVETSNKQEKFENVHFCRMMLPYYGRTNSTGKDEKSYDKTSKSYGMTFPTPDVDSEVMVIFVEGLIENGFIIGGVAEPYTNYMVPGIASSDQFHETDTTKKVGLKPGTDPVPVAEAHRLASEEKPDWLNKKRPVHKLLDTLLEQGLHKDPWRGYTSSSMIRDPIRNQSVFGVSTPGPFDPDGGTIKQGLESSVGDSNSYDWYASRLPGHTFVMDDGDIDGFDKLVRLRSGAGHQILMHDTLGVMYIGNATGKTWIELTADGHVEIYGADNFSVHAEGDINLQADKNFNVHVGESMNIVVEDDMHVHVKNSSGDSSMGNLHILTDGEIRTKSGRNTHIYSAALVNIQSFDKMNLTSGACMTLQSGGGSVFPIKLNSGPGDWAEEAVAPELIKNPTTEYNSSKLSWIASQKSYEVVVSRTPVHEPDLRERKLNGREEDPPYLK